MPRQEDWLPQLRIIDRIRAKLIENQIRFPAQPVSHFPVDEAHSLVGQIRLLDQDPNLATEHEPEKATKVRWELQRRLEETIELLTYMKLVTAIRNFDYYSGELVATEPVETWISLIMRDVERSKRWNEELALATQVLRPLKNRGMYLGDEIRGVAIPASGGYRLAVRREQSFMEAYFGAEDEVIYHIPSSSCSSFIKVREPVKLWFRTDNPIKLLKALDEANVVSPYADGSSIVHATHKGTQAEWAVLAALGMMDSERDRFPIPQRILNTLK